MHSIINHCFNNGVVPDKWKQGIINPIIKPNSTDPRKPLTYRGITLMSVPCKIYCDILNKRLTSWLEKHNILQDAQNGFRKDRNCQDNIYSLFNIVNNRKIAKQSTYSCFIDLRKAFDTVNRDCMFYKLLSLGIKGPIYDAIFALYDDVKCCVRVNNLHTDWLPVHRGVKQGCLISPTIFATYINDLIEELNSSNLVTPTILYFSHSQSNNYNHCLILSLTGARVGDFPLTPTKQRFYTSGRQVKHKLKQLLFAMVARSKL